MPHYQLEGGSHTDLQGKVYHHGDVVKTNDDLPKMFPGKFKQVGVLPVNTKLIDPDLEGLKAERQEQKAREMMSDGKAKTSKVAKAKDPAALAARGLDVTDKFPKVAEEGFSVFKREKAYHVYEGESTKPVNSEGLEKDAVEEWVKKFLEE